MIRPRALKLLAGVGAPLAPRHRQQRCLDRHRGRRGAATSTSSGGPSWEYFRRTPSGRAGPRDPRLRGSVGQPASSCRGLHPRLRRRAIARFDGTSRGCGGPSPGLLLPCYNPTWSLGWARRSPSWSWGAVTPRGRRAGWRWTTVDTDATSSKRASPGRSGRAATTACSARCRLKRPACRNRRGVGSSSCGASARLPATFRSAPVVHLGCSPLTI